MVSYLCRYENLQSIVSAIMGTKASKAFNSEIKIKCPEHWLNYCLDVAGSGEHEKACESLYEYLIAFVQAHADTWDQEYIFSRHRQALEVLRDKQAYNNLDALDYWSILDEEEDTFSETLNLYFNEY